jgi:hypothetical protein
VTSSRRELNWPTAGDMRNVGFTEFCRLVEAFGFKLAASAAVTTSTALLRSRDL